MKEYFSTVAQAFILLLLGWRNFDRVWWYRFKNAIKTLAQSIWFLIMPLLILLAPLFAVALIYDKRLRAKQEQEAREALKKKHRDFNAWR